MLGLLAPTLIAVGVAWLMGGSPRAIFESRLRGWPIILGAFAVELLLYNPPVDAQAWALLVGPWIWLFTKLVLLGAVCLNLGGAPRWPWLVIGLGLLLNTVAVALNDGHMPQSIEAANAVWGSRVLDPTRLHNVAPMGFETRLPWLCDVIAEPAWLPRANVISVGDVLLALGVAAWAFVVTIATTNRFPGISWVLAPLHGEARPSRRCSS